MQRIKWLLTLYLENRRCELWLVLNLMECRECSKPSFSFSNTVKHLLAIGKFLLTVQHLQTALNMSPNLCSSSRSVKSLWLWWRSFCLCSLLEFSLCYAKKCLLQTIQIQQCTRASQSTTFLTGSRKDFSWLMCLATPLWCVRWQRTCVANCNFPQVSSNLIFCTFMSAHWAPLFCRLTYFSVSWYGSGTQLLC